MERDFDFIDSSKESISDIKEYFFRVLAYWKWFLITIPIGVAIAYYVNISSAKSYSLNATILVKEKQNPLFSTGTNIAFNWGGVSDKVESIRRYLRSRTHNEEVVKELQFYIDYLQEGRFRINDVYGKTPFTVVTAPDGYQLLNTMIKIDFVSADRFKLTIDFEEATDVSIINYDTNEQKNMSVSTSLFEKEYELNEPIELPFLNIALQSPKNFVDATGQSYLIRFRPINAVVGRYQQVLAIPVDNTSLLTVQFSGSNKNRIVDFLNKTVEVLAENQLIEKTNYARQTLAFIDEQFKNTQDSLQLIEDDIGLFKNEENIYNLSAEGNQIFENTSSLDRAQFDLADRLEYYKNLENYIITHQNFTNIPAPAIINVEDNSIEAEVSNLTSLISQRIKLESEVTSNHPSLVSINQEIETVKSVLLENISSVINIIELQIKNSEKRLNIYTSQLKNLPDKEQQLLNYQRKYSMTETNFKYLLQKRYEADIAIAASVSDVTILDRAKDVGQQSSKPRTQFNYILGVLFSVLFPLLFIVSKEVLDTRIQTVEGIEQLTPIPVLGVIGKNTAENNLSVFHKPKASVAEAFRALRSNIHFLFDRNKRTENKTVIVTSSIGGEGKTFVSMNMATVFALSGKKTVLVGLDLRKPKIFGDFNLKNDIGVVNYLIGQKTKDEIIQETHIENLDLITAGPVPPNPSELIMTDATTELLEYLQTKYEYVILDTPPVGLVADALELIKYADVTLYVVRQNFTQKGMLKMINAKYKKDEVSNISIVLNNFKVKTKYGYGYGYGYGGYGNAYHEEEHMPFYKRIFKRKV